MWARRSSTGDIPNGHPTSPVADLDEAEIIRIRPPRSSTAKTTGRQWSPRRGPGDRSEPRRSAAGARSSRARRKAREVGNQPQGPAGEEGQGHRLRCSPARTGEELPPGVNELVRVYVARSARSPTATRGRTAREQGVIAKSSRWEGHAVPRGTAPRWDIVSTRSGVPGRMMNSARSRDPPGGWTRTGHGR